MANKFLIPDTLLIPLMQRVEEGHKTASLVEWLRTEKNIVVSLNTLSKRLSQFRRESRLAKRAAVQDIAASSIIDGVSILQDKVQKLNTEIDILLASDAKTDKELANKLIITQAKLISDLTKMTGLSPEKDDEMEDVREEMLAELNAINPVKN